MLKKRMLFAAGVALLVALGTGLPASAQLCAPLDNGRIADAFYEGTVIFWNPVVEFERVTLRISGPCEDIVKVFTSKDQIMFDIREIERITDGEYTWTLQRESNIDPGVQESLQEARFSGEEDALWWSYFQAGKIPAGPYTDSGSFTVDRGVIVDPSSGQEKVATISKAGPASADLAGAALAGGFAGADGDAGGGNTLATKDTVLTNANGVIRNSLCVGFDCANNNTYSDTTILLTENNTRIKFDDTSSINSFPRNDWEIEANSNLNGGASYLGFNDCGQGSGGGCATDLVFAVEAGVRQNALYVESDGDVGVGTSNPVVRMHLIDGDTPALRLEQDGSSGFAPQTWDVAGNETTFFIRDATNGSTLPFRIQPGASSNQIFIASDDEVGFGTTSPASALHVRRTDGSAQIQVEEASGTTAGRVVLVLRNNGAVRFNFENSNTGVAWQHQLDGSGNFDINSGAGGQFELQQDGDLTIGGILTQNSSRTVKHGFEPVDGRSILERVAAMPLTTWVYDHDREATRHIGPMAEDFYAAFEVGPGSNQIAVSDQAGVALAAIQGLHQQVAERDLETEARLEAKNDEIAELRERIAALEALILEGSKDR